MAQVISDFEQGTIQGWIQAPGNRWNVTSELALTGNYSIQHAFDNAQAGIDYIYKDLNSPQAFDTLKYSFRIRHAYNPSSANNWQAYLGSIKSDQLNDCMLFGVNYKGSDDVLRLWQIVGGEVHEIVNTGIDYEEEIGKIQAPQFTITRTPKGLWSIQMKSDGELLRFLGSGSEVSFSAGRYMGFRYAYSSAQDRKLWLDDVLAAGSFYLDDHPPLLDSVEITGLASITLYFNEHISLSDRSLIQWDGIRPDTVSVIANAIMLKFNAHFPNRVSQSISVHAVEDLEGNMLLDTMVEFRQNLSEFGEIVINEIMIDPEPAVYLPEYEFVELFNTTGFAVDLASWKFVVNSRNYEIREGKLGPGDYLILSAENTQQEYPWAQVMEVFTSLSALSNSGAELYLFDKFQRLIHTASYREVDNYEPLKSEGGWSIERIDPYYACGGSMNWKASVNSEGGTPGKENSVKATINDQDAPEIVFLGIKDTNSISLHFTEMVLLERDSDSEFLIEGWEPALPEYHTSLLADRVIDITLDKEIEKDRVYSLFVRNVADCSGNIMKEGSVEFRMPAQPSHQQVILNEIMYEPFAGNIEYLEIYNNSKEYLDLDDLKIKVGRNASASNQSVFLEKSSHLLAPDHYVVFTSNEMKLRQIWELDWNIDVVELTNWKVLPNQQGMLGLLDRADRVIDNLNYHDSMQHDLLQDPAGVALERIHSSDSNTKWISAAASENYGTPGYKNSHQNIGPEERSDIELSSRIVSPDMDGYQDYLEIVLKGFQPSSYCSIYVSDLKGSEVRQIAENAIMSSNDHFFWDAHDMNHNLVFPGIYVIHIHIYGAQGEQVYRRSCAVTYR